MKRIALLFNILVSFSGFSQLTWQDISIGNGIKPDIAISGDQIYIAFMNESFNGFVKCAEIVDGSFQTETLVSTGYFYGPLDIVIDDNSNPRIPYHDHTTEDLTLAVKNGNQWVLNQIEHEGHDGWDGSIFIDGNDQNHIVSVDPGSGIEYATKVEGNWIVENVNPAQTAYKFATSIKVRESVVHVAYYISSTDQLFYSYKDEGGWHHEVIVEGGLFPSLVLDNSGNPVIAYYLSENPTGSIQLASRQNDQWQSEKVEDLDLIDISFSGARKVVDLEYKNGTFYIAFNNKKIVRYGTLEANGWVMETAIDESSTEKILGQQISLAMDDQGKPHLAYFERAQGIPEGGTIHYLYGSGNVMPPDTMVMPPDTIVMPPDTIVMPPDTIVMPPDTTITPPDTTAMPDSTRIILNSKLPDGSSIENVVYAVRDEENNTIEMLNNGQDIILENLSPQAKQICPSRSDNATQNVSALDLVRAQRMILGISQHCINDFIAMDVNKSGDASALDIILTLNVLIGKAESFPNNDSWRFYLDEVELKGKSLNEIYELGCMQIENIPANETEVNFIGVKLGDVTCEERL